MNKELIKQYKAEFIHWLNGGNLLVRTMDYEVHQYVEWSKVSFDYAWNEYGYAHQFIIDDSYSTYRKALAEGKTVQYNPITQYNNRWDNITSINPNVHDTIKNYRIKPDEPKFKVGDLVELLYTNPKLVGVVEKLDISQAFIKWGNGKSWKSFDKLIFWQPKEGEWVCSIKDTDSFEVYRYKSYPNPKPCQPFIGTLPFNLKD